MRELPPQIITLGQPEFGVFDAAIHETYGMSLQSIADQDKELAIAALSIGLTAIVHDWGSIEEGLALIYKDEVFEAEATPKTSREIDGDLAFEGLAKLRINETVGSMMPSPNNPGRDIVVRVVCEPERTTLGYSDQETLTVAKINLSV